MIEAQRQNMGKTERQILLEDLKDTSYKSTGDGNSIALLPVLEPKRDHLFVASLLDPQHAGAESRIVPLAEIWSATWRSPRDIERRRPW